MTKIHRNAISARQSIGTRMARRAVIIGPASSKVETRGFPILAVEAGDVVRSVTVVPWTNPAIPPPAIRASVHPRNGDISVTNEAVVTVTDRFPLPLVSTLEKVHLHIILSTLPM